MVHGCIVFYSVVSKYQFSLQKPLVVLGNKGSEGTDEKGAQEQVAQISHPGGGSRPRVAGDPEEGTCRQQSPRRFNHIVGVVVAGDDHDSSCIPVCHEVLGYMSCLK